MSRQVLGERVSASLALLPRRDMPRLVGEAPFLLEVGPAELEARGEALRTSYVPETILRWERSKAVRLDSLWTKFMSRLMRIHNLARSPFDLTLFADDDTVWCPSGDLAARLRALGDPAAGAPRGADSPRPDVRFVPQASAKGNVDDARLEAERLRETAACARALHFLNHNAALGATYTRQENLHLDDCASSRTATKTSRTEA